MTHKEIGDALQEAQINLQSQCNLNTHDFQLQQVVSRLYWLTAEDGLLNIDNRIEALFALKGVLLAEIRNPRKKETVDNALGFVWQSIGVLIPMSSLSSKIGVGQKRISESYYKYMLNAA